MRPDHRALTSDTIARALGTAIGAAAVILLRGRHVITPVTNPPGLLLATSPSPSPANEGLPGIIVITIETVFTRAVVGEDPVSVAIDRVQDVTLGCGRNRCCSAPVAPRPPSARRCRSMPRPRQSGWTPWPSCARGQGRQGQAQQGAAPAHDCGPRANVQHGLDLRQVELPGPGMPPWLGQNLFTLIHDSERTRVWRPRLSSAMVRRVERRRARSRPGRPRTCGRPLSRCRPMPPTRIRGGRRSAMRQQRQSNRAEAATPGRAGVAAAGGAGGGRPASRVGGRRAQPRPRPGSADEPAGHDPEGISMVAPGLASSGKPAALRFWARTRPRSPGEKLGTTKTAAAPVEVAETPRRRDRGREEPHG